MIGVDFDPGDTVTKVTSTFTSLRVIIGCKYGTRNGSEQEYEKYISQ